jgi:flagellar protein FliL
MSDEEKKESLVEGEEGEESTSQPQKKGGFLSPFLIRILSIIVAVVGIIILFFVLLLIMLPIMLKSNNGGTSAPNVEGIKKVAVEHLQYLPFEDAFTQQLSDGKMLKLKISLGYKSGDKRLQAELTEIVPEMRDIVIKQLSRLNSEYFTDEAALDNLQEDLLKQINRIVNNGKVERILFQEFTIM